MRIRRLYAGIERRRLTVRFRQRSRIAVDYITFGTSGMHAFSFTTLGAGSFAIGPAKGGMHGAITWRVMRGFGQFKGAKGYITSNFSVDGKGRLVDNQIGSFTTK